MIDSSTLQLSTVSDLHLFCKRSRGDRYTEVIQQAATESDVFVLNGDIFDFRWSVHDSPERTVGAALEWLDRLIESAPDCRFVYVLGNHDHYGLLMDALDPFASDRPNFEWDPYFYRLGPALFLHGDCVTRRMTAADLEAYREGWLADPRRGPVLNAVYDVAFRVGVHKAIHHVAFPLDKVLDRLHHYIADIGHTAEDGVETIYFGHTHLAMPHHPYEGLVFRNAGAPMPGLEFHVLSAEVDVS